MRRKKYTKESIAAAIDSMTMQGGQYDDSWQQRALCRALEPELADRMFFNIDVSDPLKRYRRELCAQCPVQRQCLDYGNAVSPQYGCWGGLSPGQRRAQIRYESRNEEPPEGAEELEARAAI